jgi:protein-histidine pros-kinase
LLDLAKIESGKVELRRESVLCQSVVQEVLTTLRPLAEVKGLRLEAACPVEDIVIETDRRALTQILFNLTNNGIKFTKQGLICIELCRRSENGSAETIIRVRDTGIGIRPEDQARLFQAFEQVNGLAKERQQGTGLGLHLSQKLAELLGGRITLHSEFGKGSTFAVVLKE